MGNGHFVEKLGELKLYAATVLIPLKTGKNFSGCFYLSITFFLSEECNFFRNIIRLDQWVESMSVKRRVYLEFWSSF